MSDKARDIGDARYEMPANRGSFRRARSIGDAIRRMREDEGLKQADLARVVHVSQSTVSAWEKGRSVPSMLEAIRIDHACGQVSGTLMVRCGLIGKPPVRNDQDVEEAGRHLSKTIPPLDEVLDSHEASSMTVQIPVAGLSRPLELTFHDAARVDSRRIVEVLDEIMSMARHPSGQPAEPAPADVPREVVQVTSFDDLQVVADKFKAGIAVVVAYGYAPGELHERITDFVSGLCYGRGGRLERIGDSTYLLMPPGIIDYARVQQAAEAAVTEIFARANERGSN